MKINYQIFTQEEIEEIELFKEASKNTRINEEPIICFEILSKIINGKVDINKMSRDELLRVYAQLKTYAQSWDEIIWLDGRMLKKITPKVRSLIKEILSLRKLGTI